MNIFRTPGVPALQPGSLIRIVTAGLAAVCLLVLPLAASLLPAFEGAAAAYAGDNDNGGKPNDNGGGGGGGGGNEGGGKPDSPGNGKGDLYADLVLTYRNEDGLPYFVGVPEGEEEPEEADAISLRTRGESLLAAEGYVACEQPITSEAIEGDGYIDTYGAEALVLWSGSPLGNPVTNDADLKLVSPVPLGGAGFAGEECDVSTTPNPDYTDYPKEVHFGRLNVGRSPVDVLRQQLDDVLDVFEGKTLGYDFAARLMANGLTVDSPLQSLALHRELLIEGELATPQEGTFTLPDLPWIPEGDDKKRLISMELAASALGAAADKGDYDVPGGVTLDLVVFNSRILQIPANTKFDVFYGDGEIGVNQRAYYDFSLYSYDRETKYPGCVYGITIEAEPFQGTIMDWVFAGEAFSADNVWGFATAADDSRRVIAFAHETEFYIVLDIDDAGDDSLCEALEP